MRKQQFLLVLIFASFTLAALNYNSVITMSAASNYQQSNLAASDTFVMNQVVSLNQAVINGNLLVVAVSAYSSGTADIAAVTDSAGNKYLKAVANPATPAGKHAVSIWYAPNVTGGANFTITATSANEPAYITIAAHEYSGIETGGPLDQVRGASGTGTLASTGPTPATSQAEELIFGAFLHQEAGVVDASAGPGFTMLQSQTKGTIEPLVTLEQFVQAQNGFGASLNWASPATWNGVVATFKLKSTTTNPPPTPTVQITTPPGTTTDPPPTPPPPPTPTPPGPGNTYTQASFPVGLGGSDNIPHQLVRTRDDRVYIFGYLGQRSPIIKAYWTTGTGLPSSNSSWNSSQVMEGELAISVDTVYDGESTIHVLMNTNAGNIKDYVFDISTNTFKPPFIISRGNPTIPGDYVGTSGLSGMIDLKKVVHLAYWSRDNHISYRAFSYEPARGSFTMQGNPIQLDTAGSANHPALAISPVDGSITVAWISEANNTPKILARSKSGGSWGAVETVSAATPWTSTSAGVNIDQGPSLIIDNKGARHLAYIENYDSTRD
ncbi:MAG: repeat/fibronectin type domain protein, partial [Chloroflexi bacterium]|nr:repeat/fibronectin type domain protein [Chloroflexota bacterium]